MANYYHLPFLVALTIWVASISTIAQDDQTNQEQPGGFFLQDKSFQVATKITRLFSTTGFTVHQVNEKYSWGQRRAKIQFRAEHKPISELNEPHRGLEIKSGTYFVDKKADIVIYSDRLLPKCQLSSLDNLHAEWLVGLADYRHLLINQPDDKSDHLVGPVQLLSLVAANKHKLIKSGTALIRNIGSNEYRLELPEVGWFHVYYNEKDDFNNAKTIPFRVSYEDKNVKLLFDYSPIKLLHLDSFGSTLHRQVDSGQVALDDFVFPALSGCSAALDTKGAHHLFASHKWPNRFSFTADIKQQQQQQLSPGPSSTKRLSSSSSHYTIFVAHDESLHSLRVDTLESDLTYLAGPGRLLYNFLANKVYHLRSSSPADSEQNNSIDFHQTNQRAIQPNDCVVGKISGANNVQVKMSPGELLTGSSRDSFVYLGRAQVRGISSLVYEVAGSKLPFWLEPPAANENAELLEAKRKTNKQLNDDANDDGDDQQNTQTILFYFGQRETDHPLLLVEIFHHSKEFHKKIYSKQTIEIFNFKWDLETIAPGNGDRASEMFSLRDLCAADDSPSGHVELVIEQETPELSNETYEWLSTTPLRNQAIISGLQEALDVSAANVFDLESRVRTNPTDKKHTLYVSFRHANHRRKVKKLVYLGKGDMKTNSQNSILMFNVHSFRDCFLLAAHRQEDIYFAFDSRDNKCFIDEQPVDYSKSARAIAEEANNFVLIEQLHLNVYRVFEDYDFNMAFMSYWTKSQSNFASRVELHDKLITFGYREPRDKRASFKIKRVHLREANTGGQQQQQQQLTLNNKTNQILEELKEIQGYGLSLNDAEFNQALKSIEVHPSLINPLISSTGERQQEQAHEFGMTPNHCHSRCLIDLECQSYSICLASYKFECILSKLSFKSGEILKQIKANKLARGQKVLVAALDLKANQTANVHLIKRSACTVYNKQYLDFFKQTDERGKVMASNWAILTVESREQCASLCGGRNFKINSQIISQPMEHHQNLFQDQTNKDSNVGQSTVHSKLNLMHSLQNQLCFKFMYMSHVDFMNLAKEIRERFWFHHQMQQVPNGYCMINKHNLDEPLEESKVSIPDNSLDYLDAEYYQFELVHLYDESHGLALKGSQLTSSETFAHTRVRNNNEASSEDLESMKSLSAMGENFQIYSNYGDKHSCARLCFMQTRNPWPTCRSFDVVIERMNNDSVARCRFNSVSLNQVLINQKYHLIENQTDRQMWHYEPRLGLMLNSLMLNDELEFNFVAQTAQSKSSTGHFGVLFAVVLLALLSGLSLGVVVHQKYLTGLGFTSSIERTNSITELVMDTNNVQFELTHNKDI